MKKIYTVFLIAIVFSFVFQFHRADASSTDNFFTSMFGNIATDSSNLGANASGAIDSNTAVVSPTPSSNTAATPDCNALFFTKTLSVGQKNNQVKALQIILGNGGYLDGAVDGAFGAKTKAALKAYQTDNGISATGSVGPFTREKLNTLWQTMCTAGQNSL
jgi:murein L,D-transpeptidase YcbB/YkuD